MQEFLKDKLKVRGPNRQTVVDWCPNRQAKIHRVLIGKVKAGVPNRRL